METIAETKLFKTRIDIKEKNREKLVSILNQQLADTFDLYSQTKQAHWNVKGIEFMQLHLFFDQLAESVEPFSDMIAERVTALGGVAQGTVRMAAKGSSLKEMPNPVDGKAFVEALAERYAAYAASTRKAIEKSGDLDDPTTEDLFTEISRTIDKDLFFIEAHLQGK
ncbi:MAG: DNA starvation/stationary phase protection protein Dps [Trueperaceae bacterium]|nr:DNA starvation/stationary phase protection protein Dps [Trueperaceae bacterium]